MGPILRLPTAGGIPTEPEVLGATILVGIRAMPDEWLATTFHLVAPLWLSSGISVWRSGAGLLDLEEPLARALVAGDIWSAALVADIPEPSQRWIATRWPAALVVSSEVDHPFRLDSWTQVNHMAHRSEIHLSVHRPDRRGDQVGGGHVCPTPPTRTILPGGRAPSDRRDQNRVTGV
jgi:hypothetical protein